MPHTCAPKPHAHMPNSQGCECYYQPKVDILEKEEEIILFADLPGASPDSIEIDYDDGKLSIQAKVEARQDGETQYLVHQYGVGDYRRTFQLSEVVDPDRISAKFTDGVLTVHLPKVQAAKPRRIAVHTN